MQHLPQGLSHHAPLQSCQEHPLQFRIRHAYLGLNSNITHTRVRIIIAYMEARPNLHLPDRAGPADSDVGANYNQTAPDLTSPNPTGAGKLPVQEDQRPMADGATGGGKGVQFTVSGPASTPSGPPRSISHGYTM